ncbi:MAG: hypothetical protein ING65_09600 [Rhodocyclaceae bacterium]|nr:hypothetical protein [Rhodocyclaceae bacterium]
MKKRKWLVLQTDDGSPTLLPEEGSAQAMHSLQGALSETLHVYGPLADALVHRRVEQKAVVVGLGLGYIEALLAATSLQSDFEPTFLLSYESELELQSAFLASLCDDGSCESSPSSLVAIMTDVRRRVALAKGVDTEAMRSLLFRWHKERRLLLLGALDEETIRAPESHSSLAEFGALFFDAYSEAASHELWTPTFLSELLSLAAPKAGVATYAARGPLTRALRAHGFTRTPRSGYGRKRECTLAFRQSD